MLYLSAFFVYEKKQNMYTIYRIGICFVSLRIEDSVIFVIVSPGLTTLSLSLSLEVPHP